MTTIRDCPECGGSGVLDEGTEHERRCDYCGGRGFVPDGEDDDSGVLQTLRPLSSLFFIT